jgi:hexokinase
MQKRCICLPAAVVHKKKCRNEEGLFYGLDLGGTNFRVLRVQLAGKEERVAKRESREVSIPRHLMSGSAAVRTQRHTSILLYTSFHCSVLRMTDVLHSPGPVLAKFVANEHNALLLDGKRRELGFTFSFPVRQTSIACGTLTKRVNIDDAVSQ